MEISCGDAAANKAGLAKVWKMLQQKQTRQIKKSEIDAFGIIQLQDCHLCQDGLSSLPLTTKAHKTQGMCDGLPLEERLRLPLKGSTAGSTVYYLPLWSHTEMHQNKRMNFRELHWTTETDHALVSETACLETSDVLSEVVTILRYTVCFLTHRNRLPTHISLHDCKVHMKYWRFCVHTPW